MSNKPNPARDFPEPKPPNDQGLPQRPVPYQPVPGIVQFTRCAPVEGQDEPLIAMIYDSPDTRVVSYWAESAFLALAQRMTKFVGAPVAELTVADMSDLAALRDAGQIVEP